MSMKLLQLRSLFVIGSRCVSRDKRPYLMDLYRRRLKAGPEPERPRSVWSNWSYDAEVFAFSKRLKEDFENSLVRLAFVDKSFLEQEVKKRQNVDLPSLDTQDNTILAQEGGELIISYSGAYLRACYPYVPEEWLQEVGHWLSSDSVMARVGAHLGVKDLILSAEFPHSLATIATTFKAVVGALAKSQGPDRAQLFVRDFVVTQLAGRDINQLFTIRSPMKLLVAVLEKHNRGPPEPRLISQSAMDSVLACYHVGIYSDQELLARSPGESIEIAEEEAAKECLKILFGTADHRAPLPFHATFSSLDLTKKNPSILDYSSKSDYDQNSRHNSSLS